MPGIGVVVNPHAKGNRSESSDRERRMADILGSDGTVRVTATLDAVDQVAHEFVDRNIDILAICGGDGSSRFAPAPSTISPTRPPAAAALPSRCSPASSATTAAATRT